MYEELMRFQTSAPDRYTTVVVAASGGDYTTIKAAVAGVTPTALAPVKIYVRNGTYNEIQIDGKDYLSIEGESRAGVIMVSDGTRTDVDPVSGQRYVDMAVETKHGFWIHHSMLIKNMTIRVNDVKYCIHADNPGAYRLRLENVNLEHHDGYPLGVGAWAGQGIELYGCALEKLGENIVSGAVGTHGIYWHNWDNQAAAAWLTLKDCEFINCGIAYLFELGSDQSDLITAINCTTDDKGFYWDVTNYYYEPAKETNAEIPYCINLLTVGGTFPATIDCVVADRPNLMNHVSIN